jgi:hypothetical protein
MTVPGRAVSVPCGPPGRRGSHVDRTSFRDTPRRSIAYVVAVIVTGFLAAWAALSVVALLPEELGGVATGDLARAASWLAATQ